MRGFRIPRSDHGRGGEIETIVTLERHDNGFGFRIVGGTEEGSQVRNVSIVHCHVI